MVVHLARFVFFVAGALGGLEVASLVDWSEQTGFPPYIVIILFVMLGSSIGYLFGGIFGREVDLLFDRAGEHVGGLAVPDLVLGAAGLFAGLLFALLVSTPLKLLQPAWISFVTIALLYALAGYGGFRLALTKREEFAAHFSPSGGESLEDRPVAKYLDTSALIDGRFADLRRSGLLEGRISVPVFVLAELQTLADSADDVKRARGRRGLDILETVRIGDNDVEVFHADYSDITDVDAKLLRLATETAAGIVTVDYNLTKVARVQRIPVVNLNELAQVLRPVVQAGDGFIVRVAKKGKEAGQGVGYLEDGTMVVIEDAAGSVGEEVEIHVNSIFQASAGRMVFARLKSD